METPRSVVAVEKEKKATLAAPQKIIRSGGTGVAKSPPADNADFVVLEIIFMGLPACPLRSRKSLAGLGADWAQPETSCTVYMPVGLVSYAGAARHARKSTVCAPPCIVSLQIGLCKL